MTEQQVVDPAIVTNEDLEVSGPPVDPAYPLLIESVESLRKEFANSSDVSAEDKTASVRAMLAKISRLQEVFYEVMRKINNNGSEVMDNLYPKRDVEIVKPLSQMEFECLSKIPPGELTEAETVQLTERLADFTTEKEIGFSSKLYLVGARGGYITLDHMSHKKDSMEASLVKDIHENQERVLDEDELKKVLEHEKTIYKLHLNVPLEQRLPLIYKLLKERAKSIKIANDLREKTEPGTEIKLEDMKEAGASLAWLNNWKFKGLNDKSAVINLDLQGNRFPDFVFYTRPGDPSTAQINFENLKNELSLIVREFEDQGPEIPRFSTPVQGPDGHQHVSFSQAQGDGDFKLYLQRQGVLDKYYSAENNFSAQI